MTTNSDAIDLRPLVARRCARRSRRPGTNCLPEETVNTCIGAGPDRLPLPLDDP
jgi:hypothetical protein